MRGKTYKHTPAPENILVQPWEGENGMKGVEVTFHQMKSNYDRDT